MKKLSTPTIKLLCSAAIFVFIIGPFFKVQTRESYTGVQAPYNLSGLSFVLENIDGYFTNAIPAPNKSLVIISFTVGIIILMQFVAGLIKREKLIVATSVIMTLILVAGMLYILNSDFDVTVRWGYYLYLTVQLVLAGGTPLNNEAPKPKLD